MRKTLSIHYLTLTAICLVCIASCSPSDPPTTPNLPDPGYDAFYAYFPSEDGYQWTYEEKTYDGQENLLSSTTITGTYNKDNQSIEYKNGSYSNWYNSGSMLRCCNGAILLDYKEVNCNDDSTLISEKYTESGTFSSVYQFCKFQTAEVENYDDIDCIKTYQKNTFTDGSELHIERYFGKNIGLIYEKQTAIDLLGRVFQVNTKVLESHEF